MQTPTRSITFDIELETKSHSRTPSNIAKKLEECNSLRGKRSLSQEDLQAKLDNAAERKKCITDIKSLKGKEAVEKAKAIASKARLELEVEVAEKLGKLKEKLDSAAEKKEHHYFLKKQRIEQHLSTVEERKSTFGSPCKDMTTLAQKLQAAEIRRKALEEEKINKLVEHHKAVETMKESSPLRASPNKINIKLEQAEQRRKTMEKEHYEKLAKRQEHANAVRKRKSLGGENIILA